MTDVERGARAIHALVNQRLGLSIPWEALQDTENNCYLDYARAVLDANGLFFSTRPEETRPPNEL